jgi:hypothetical protein
MKDDTYAEFSNLLDFMGEEIEKRAVKKSIEKTIFENMKKMEESNELNDNRLKVRDNEDENSRKVRKGKVGGFKEELDEQDLKYLDEQIKKLNQEIGYKPR